MEFLRTPEPAAAQLAAQTPRTPLTAGNGAGLDRAGIKSSFQQLFTPNHAPAFLPAASGLTPFLGPGATPNFVTPGIGMMPMGSPAQKNSAEIMLSSPYLQAAAKEAVRREFMNMPSYITGNAPVPVAAVPVIPGGSPPQPQVYSSSGRPVASSLSAQVSPSSGTAKGAGTTPTTQQPTDENNNRVVPTDSNKNDNTADDTDSESAAKVPQSANTAANSKTAPTNVPPPAAASMPYAGHHPPFFAPPGVFLMPQMVPGQHVHPHHAHMNGGVFVHPGNGMMMTYAGIPGMGMPGMAMMMPQMANVNAQGLPIGTKPIPKHETNEQRKVRVEEEKQELIREFKKKTREAALVRFRQKRRERRFGKLIRYACRKQLADARPRVKGRFVRIKEDEQAAGKPETRTSTPSAASTAKKSRKKKKTSEEAPQVVPNIK